MAWQGVDKKSSHSALTTGPQGLIGGEEPLFNIYFHVESKRAAAVATLDPHPPTFTA